MCLCDIIKIALLLVKSVFINVGEDMSELGCKIDVRALAFHKMLKLLSRALQKNWNFPLRISSVYVTKSAVSCGFGHIYWINP